LISQKLGTNEETLIYFNKAIELNPHPLYYVFLGISLKNLHRYEESLEKFLRAEKIINSDDFAPKSYKLNDKGFEFIKESLKNINELNEIIRDENHKIYYFED